MFDYLIVGAGFAGSVLAERLASQANKKILIIDKRNHIAGNAFDHYDRDGILVPADGDRAVAYYLQAAEPVPAEEPDP